jgi:hypothetical protein
MERPKTLGTIVSDAVVYCLRETKKRSLSMLRVIISLVAGVVMSSFYPFVWRVMTRGGRTIFDLHCSRPSLGYPE